MHIALDEVGYPIGAIIHCYMPMFMALFCLMYDNISSLWYVVIWINFIKAKRRLILCRTRSPVST